MQYFEQKNLQFPNGKKIPIERVFASRLSPEDNFLKHTPKNESEKWLKGEVERVIRSGVSNFCYSTLAPTLDEKGHICFDPDKRINPYEFDFSRSPDEWVIDCNSFLPKSKIKAEIGTNFQYIARKAMEIKMRHDSGTSIEQAWESAFRKSKRDYSNAEGMFMLDCEDSEIFWTAYPHDFPGNLFRCFDLDAWITYPPWIVFVER